MYVENNVLRDESGNFIFEFGDPDTPWPPAGSKEGEVVKELVQKYGTREWYFDDDIFPRSQPGKDVPKIGSAITNTRLPSGATVRTRWVWGIGGELRQYRWWIDDEVLVFAVPDQQISW